MTSQAFQVRLWKLGLFLQKVTDEKILNFRSESLLYKNFIKMYLVNIGSGAA